MIDNPYVGPRALRDGEELYGREQERRRLQNVLIAKRIVLLYSPSGAGKTSLIQAALLPALWEEGFLVLPIIRVGTRLKLNQEFPSETNPYVLSTLLSLEKREKFTLTRRSLKHLKDNKIPENILDDLNSLRWRGFSQETKFLETVKNRIGKTQLDKYQKQILKYAQKNSAPKGSLVELANMGLANYLSLDQRFNETSEANFKLTTQSWASLRNEDIPDNILDDLKHLEDRTFIGENKFLSAVKEQIGQDHTVRYEELILKHATSETKEVVMVFDQFEEILTANPFDLGAKKEFFTQLGKVLKHGNRWAIFSMREEFVTGLDPYLHLLPTRLRTRFRLELLKEEAANKAIRGPAEKKSITFADDVVTQLTSNLSQVWVQQVGGGRKKQPGLYIEPVQLQVVCYQLWDKLPSTIKHVKKTDIKNRANVDTALAHYYKAQVEKAASDCEVSEWDIREWFEHHLITEHGFRGQVLKTEGRSQGLDNKVIDFLVEVHLVRAEKRLNSTWFELAHDRLIEPVKKNNARWFWRNEDKIEGMAEAVYGRLNEAEQELLQKIFTRLVRVREDVAYYTRQSISIKALESELGEIGPLLQRLEWERLLSFNKETMSGSEDSEDVVELATKALIRKWPRLQDWLEQTKESQRNRYKIRQAASEWRRHNKEESFLMRGSQLVSTEEILSQNSITLNQLEQEYVKACITFRDQEEKKQERRINTLRWLVEGLVVVLLFAIGAAGFAVNRAGVARKAEHIAKQARDKAQIAQRIARSGQLATQAQLDFDESPPRSLLLALEAVKETRSQEERRESLAEEILREILAKTGGKSLRGHTKAVNAVAISPDDRWLVTGSTDKTIKLWDLTAQNSTVAVTTSSDKKTLPAAQMSAIVQSIFSPDNRWLITKHDDGTIKSWDLNSHNPIETVKELSVQEEELDIFTIGPDCNHLFIGKSDGTVHLWDLTDQNSSTPDAILGQTDNTPVLVVTLSSDGRWLVSGKADGTASVWDLSRQNFTEPIVILPGHKWGVLIAAISPDGHWVVTGDGDDIVRLWELMPLNPNKTATILAGHKGPVRAVTISADSQWVLTGSDDKTARLWNLTTSNPAEVTTVLNGHEAPVGAVTMSADNRWIVTGSDDKTVRLWDLKTMSTALNPGDRGTIAISRQGVLMVTGGWNGTIQVRDLNSHDYRAQMIRHNADEQGGVSFETNALSPDGSLIAMLDQENDILVWESDALISAGRPSILNTGENAENITTIAISTGNRWLAAGSRDGMIRIWDIEQMTSEEPHFPFVEWPGYTDSDVESVVISSDDRWLLTKDLKGVVKVWDVEELKTGQSPPLYAIVPEQTGEMFITAMSANNSRLVTGSRNGIVKLWDIEQVNAAQLPTLLAELPRHKGTVLTTAISPDNHWLVTGGENGVARLWDLTASSENPLAMSTALRWNEGPVEAVAIHVTQPQVITGNRSGSFRLWDLDIDAVMQLGCDLAGRNFSQEEQEKYFPERRHKKDRITCPEYTHIQ
ncbi:MAG: hypothetical protein GY801_01120 [bacterium]|nr:hypothetical protein [bacterium]